MRVAEHQPVGFVLRAGEREPKESYADAFAGRAIHADPVLWEQENEGVAGNQGTGSEPQARVATDGIDGNRSRVSEAEAEPARRRPSDLSVLAERNQGGARQPGVEHRHHLYPDGAGLR